MEQIEKMIASREDHLLRIDKLNQSIIDNSNFSLAYQNLSRSVRIRFAIALLKWRTTRAPRNDILAALKASEQMIRTAERCGIGNEIIYDDGDVVSIVVYMSYLVDKPADIARNSLCYGQNDRAQHADVEMDYLLIDALEGNMSVPRWLAGLERLASKKRQALAEATYRTYLDLLCSVDKGDNVDALVREAEDNYEKRARDAFFEGGPTYMGGGPDNPYVVDFQLACILKHIGWNGASIHKWNW